MTTEIKRNYSGEMSAETTVLNGLDSWMITTSKGYNGKLNSTAQRVEISEGNSSKMVSFEMFSNDGSRINLRSEKVSRATEKAITEAHAAALEVFKGKQEAGELPINKAKAGGVQVGTVIFTDFQCDKKDKRVIYEISKDNWGTNYKTVLLNGQGFDIDNRVKPYSEKFGIGVYYNEGEPLMSKEDIKTLIDKATAYEEAKEIEIKAAEEAAKQYRAKAIEEGSKIIKELPKWAKSVIVAELKQDDSDHQTDYFSASVQKTIFLAFSSHDKNNFSEMRKAALNSKDENINALAIENKENENRENYSGGDGYYLGESKYRGWNISKGHYSMDNRTLETLQIAAYEGRFFAPLDESKPEALKPTNTPNLSGKIQFIDYSEKAFAVIGETKPLADKLKELGGSFNARLSCGAGWIFSKKKFDSVKAALSPQQEEEAKPEENSLIDSCKDMQKAVFNGSCFVEVTERLFYEMLEVLPPIWLQNKCFQVSEAFQNDLYYTFGRKDGKFYGCICSENFALKIFDSEGTLKDETKAMINFFAETDKSIYGHVTEGTREAERVQNVELLEY